MRRIVTWFRSWFATSSALRETEEVALQSAERAIRSARGFGDQVRGDILAMESMRDTLDRKIVEARRYEQELDKVRSELEVLSRDTVPALIAHNKLILQRIQADTVIHSARSLPNREV